MLRTVYPYIPNENVNISEDDENVKKFNSYDDFVGKLFPRLFHRDQTSEHSNRKGIYILNYKRFIINLNNYLND